MAPDTVHRREEGVQKTYRVADGVDATGKTTGTHVFLIIDDGPQYVGEGDPVDDHWQHDEELTNDDAPQSALDAVTEALDG